MPLTEIDYAPGQDSMDEVFDKTNAAIVELNTNQIKWKVINIGNWDMDATNGVTVNHGIADFTKIRSVTATIQQDGSSFLLDLSYFNGTVMDGGLQAISPTGIGIVRRVGGIFDTASFDDTPFNRGWITIGYVE